MIKANQARELTEQAIKNEIETRAKRAEEFCEKEIGPKINQACEIRRNEVTIQDIPKQLYSYVIGILKDNGYVVTQLNNQTLVVIW